LIALRQLRDHGELLSMLADPTEGRRPSRDDPGAIEGLRGDLDESKFEALEGAWNQLPLFLVQGPPGVGKTKLVQGLVASRIASSPMDRMLLSAQSHSAVDHLLEEIGAAFETLTDDQRDRLLPLRCRAPEAEAKTPWDREVQAGRISAALADSGMVHEAPARLRKKAEELARRYDADRAGATPRSGEDVKVDRSFENLLLRSANLVFATTNSSDLARLLEQRGHFDWVVLEEAGKATGVELLAPMMLSHRRLLIGDHQQLPAFDADRLRDLLSDFKKVEAAIDAGMPIISPIFRKLNMEIALETLRDVVDERLCAEAVGMLSLFETLVTPHVIERLPASPEPSIGRQLLQQHRMHPVLGTVISDVFYKSKVEPSAGARARFAEDAPVGVVVGSPLPDQPFVLVDVPYVRASKGVTTPEVRPAWSNPHEAALVVRVLRQLRPAKDARPSLVVLTPYQRQVRVLENAIARDDEAMRALAGFRSGLPHWVGTVDSFQGNEADVVVVSLVRNNGHVGRRALGFLADERRMNVLLSRAKWRLIVVGSLDFLRSAASDDVVDQNGPDLSFLHRLVGMIAPEEGPPMTGLGSMQSADLLGSAS
jgi:hypothetical protein